jgi:hypothetical protein
LRSACPTCAAQDRRALHEAFALTLERAHAAALRAAEAQQATALLDELLHLESDRVPTARAGAACTDALLASLLASARSGNAASPSTVTALQHRAERGDDAYAQAAYGLALAATMDDSAAPVLFGLFSTWREQLREALPSATGRERELHWRVGVQDDGQ